jgi:hypothetical protein
VFDVFSLEVPESNQSEFIPSQMKLQAVCKASNERRQKDYFFYSKNAQDLYDRISAWQQTVKARGKG